MMERITKAAIRKDGKIFIGRRHAEIIERHHREIGGHIYQQEQGFLTDNGRFVNRQEAGKIAYKAGQIINEAQTLYSEDLW